MKIHRTLLINSLAAIVALTAALAASAQSMVGEWTHYPVYTGAPDRIFATNDGGMFYQVGTRMYAYSDGVFSDMAAKFHSNTPTKVYYTPQGGFLAVGFSDGNIDLVFDGHDYATNFSDIKDAAMNVSKQINDFEYHDGRLYVATDFGLVVYDVDKGVVLQSGVYNVTINQVATLADRVMLISGSTFYYAPINGLLNRLENFAQQDGVYVKEAYRLGDNRAVFNNYGSVSVRVATDDGMSGSGPGWSSLSSVAYLMADNAGGFYAVQGNDLNHISTGATIDLAFTLPSALQANSLGICRGLSTIWAGGADGVGLFSLSNDGADLTVLQQKSIPAGAMTVEKVEFIRASADGQRIYFNNAGSCRTGANGNQAQFIDCLANGTFTDVRATNTIIRSPSVTVEDPDDPTVTWVSSRNGVFVVKSGELIATYNAYNAPFRNPPQTYAIHIDRNGNLWLGAQNDNNAEMSGGIKFLPAASRRKLTGIEASEWHVYDNLQGYSALWHGTFVDCVHSNMVSSTGYAMNGLTVINTRGTLDDPTDDFVYFYCNPFNDTDGKSFTAGQMCIVTEDLDGRVWVGTTKGIFYIANNDDALNGTLMVTRPKVPRNDGTNFADYMLDGVCVLDISVDGLNRKWVATENGVYCLNETGTEILEHHTIDNSALTNNNIRAIYADKSNNMVYVGTNSGAFAYASTSIPGANSYDNVYAYPNPVRPEFTGWITVTGLMDGSLIKIADINGNIVHSGRSSGGMYVWDGCTPAGSRVKSGVYVVYASQNLEGSSAAVTKILILNH